MAEVKMGMRKLSELVLDDKVQPRSAVSRTTVSRVRSAIRNGEVIPPPLVDERTNTLVDGRARHRAYLQEHGEEYAIEVELRSFTKRRQMLEEAARINVRHGEPLSEIDRLRTALHLRQMGSTTKTICRVLNISPEELKARAEGRIATLVPDKSDPEPRPREVVLPNLAAHKAGQEITTDQYEAIRKCSGPDQRCSAENLLRLLNHDLLDLDDPLLMRALRTLYENLGKLFASGAVVEKCP